MIPVDPVDLDWMVDLVNEYSTATRAVAGEQGEPYQDLSSRADAPGFGTQLAQRQMTEAADGLFAVFAAAPDGHGVAENLNALIRPGAPQLVVAGGGAVGRTYFVDSKRLLLAVGSALALLEFIEAQGCDRLGTCLAAKCADVFIDRSQQRNRSYCSQTCQTRERVSRHRRRRAQPKGRR